TKRVLKAQSLLSARKATPRVPVLSSKTQKKLRGMNQGLRKSPIMEVVQRLEDALKRIRALERQVRELRTRQHQSDDIPIG
ncbi:MAG: hypothetical protein WA048_02075, partial [Minisyncoccia bacterium]